MTRTERIRRLAQLRGDKAALAIMEGQTLARSLRRSLESADRDVIDYTYRQYGWTESELRAAWGDR
jgi:hypothetical protein